jgi:translation initiation factor 5A
MVLKIIDATEARVGTVLMVEGQACTVKSIDISKTGKHGHAKCRIEAVAIISGSKKVFVVPGHERFEVPLIDKRKGQVLSVMDDKVSIMDLENFETIEINVDSEIKGQLGENDNVEYWDIEGDKIVKRKL